MMTAHRAPAAMAVRAASELRPALVQPHVAARVETRLGRFTFHKVSEPALEPTPTYAVLA